MQPMTVGILIVLNHRMDAGERNEEDIEEVNKNFTPMKDNFDVLKKPWKKCYRKITLNGRISLNENFLEDLGTNLRLF